MADVIDEMDLVRFSISTGSPVDSGFLITAMTSDERLSSDPDDDHSYIAFRKDGVWKILENRFPIRGQARIPGTHPIVISVSPQGSVRRTGRQGGNNEAMVGDASKRKVFGRTVLDEIRAVDGKAYVVGTRRAVYRRDAENSWACIDMGCYTDDDFEAGFHSIHGFSDREIYAVGDRGEIWQFDGSVWRQRDSGTNATLLKVVCADDGFVYAAGMEGVVLKGREDQWEPMKDVDPGYQFWGIECFQGRIFLTGNTRLVFEVAGDGSIQLVDFGDCRIPLTAYHLAKDETRLYCFGAKDIRSFDGREWEEVLTL